MPSPYATKIREADTLLDAIGHYAGYFEHLGRMHAWNRVNPDADTSEVAKLEDQMQEVKEVMYDKVESSWMCRKTERYDSG